MQLFDLVQGLDVFIIIILFLLFFMLSQSINCKISSRIKVAVKWAAAQMSTDEHFK